MYLILKKHMNISNLRLVLAYTVFSSVAFHASLMQLHQVTSYIKTLLKSQSASSSLFFRKHNQAVG